MLKKPAYIILCLLLAAAIGLLPGCGRKGKLYPRDKLDYTDEELPPEWRYLPEQPPAAEIGIDGLLEKAGDPARLQGRDLTPKPAAESEASPTPESETDEGEAEEETP